MKITLQIQILDVAAQSDHMNENMEHFHAAAKWIVGELFAAEVTNKITAQKLLDLKRRFATASGWTAILCIHRAVEVYKRDTSIRPVFRPDAAITYDVRTLSFQGTESVSMLTLSGRIVVPSLMAGDQAEWIGYLKGQSDLVRRHDGRWSLLITVDILDGAEVPADDFLGVDMGLAKSRPVASQGSGRLEIGPRTGRPTVEPEIPHFSGMGSITPVACAQPEGEPQS